MTPDLSLDLIRKAVARAQRAAWQGQSADGAWYSPGYLGPVSTARVALTLHFLGVLDETTRSTVRSFLLGVQRPDGSFARYPLASEGCPCTTAVVWAAMRVAGIAEDAKPAARARAFVDAHGGLTRVAHDVYRFDPQGIFIALAGMLDPHLLPEPPAGMLLLPGVTKLATKHVNAYGLFMFPALAAIVHHLRDQSRGWLESKTAQHAIELITSFQNDNGSFNNVVAQTALATAALFALGLPLADPRLSAAVRWLHGCLAPDGDARVHDRGCHVDAFATEVWTTGLMLRALLASGVPRTHDGVASAIRWLAGAQILRKPPALVPIPAGSPGIGGWAFEADNLTTPDCDDTAIVLGALGMALERHGTDALDEATASVARLAAQRGVAWLLPMQNADGGWPAFQHGSPGKQPGPILTEYPAIPKGIGLHDIELLGPPYSWIFGDPATEDVTARALFGLAANGYTLEAPAVARAVAFLKAQQCTAEHLGNAPEQGDGGPWWSRWICNYLAATAYVLGGLATSGVDLGAPWIRRAIDWVKRRQNPDGGWGEDAKSYQEPRLAGIGESTPVLTGLVLSGLIQAGEGACPKVARGIAYLLREQRLDGSWPNGRMLHVFFKVDTFYTFDAPCLYYPLEAIGRYLRMIERQALPIDRDDVEPALPRSAAAGSDHCTVASPSARDDTFLEAMRQVGDPAADHVVEAAFAKGTLDSLNAFLAKLFRNDDPIPPGLPPGILDYLESTATLPSWVDPERVAHAQRLFTRCGWTGALALFCSSLPQSYAAAKGAKVLLGTQGMTWHVERRIFETAQFLFDVMSEGALSAKGRGIHAAQKVRLLHAAIRHLTLRTGRWDMASGIPINQEDLAGTLMSFSFVVLDAWRRFGLDITPDEAEAWIHAWNAIGHLLGIHPELLPRDVADADALTDAIRRRQWSASQAGRELTRALVAMMDRHLPHFAVAGLPVTVMRYLAGDHCCDLLGLPRSDWTHTLLHILTAIESRVSHLERESAMRTVLGRAAFDLMKVIVLAERSGKQARFRIPPALLHEWNLAD